MNRKYMIDTPENVAFLKEMGDGLLTFGRKFPAPGGSSYYLGDDGTPWKERPRETWITSRMAHVYSIGFLQGNDWCGPLADAAIKGLRGELHDENAGGYYAGRTEDGGILPGKHCYAHAFVILAATSGVLAGREGAEALLQDALSVYDKYFWMEEEGRTRDTWNTDFTIAEDYRGLNANMHSVEALLAAADVTGDEKYCVRAGRIIDAVAAWAEQNDWRIPEHYDGDWNVLLDYNKEKPDDPFKPYGATPGHGIEWSRLILQYACSAFGEDAHYLEISEQLYARARKDAWNTDGAPGICYTVDWEGKPIVHDRMHWTLAEAINTSACLYRVTGKETYALHYAEYMAYLDACVMDHVNGSWFHQLDRKNQVLDTVWPGKADLYHAFQATLIPYCQAAYSVCPAVKLKKYAAAYAAEV